jgi:hypothetical protein
MLTSKTGLRVAQELVASSFAPHLWLVSMCGGEDGVESATTTGFGALVIVLDQRINMRAEHGD